MKQEQPEEESVSPGSFYPEPSHSDRSDIVEQQLDSGRTTSEIKAYLLGTQSIFNDENGRWELKPAEENKKLMNDAGVDAIMSAITPLLSPQVVLAYINQKEAIESARQFEINLVEHLVVHWNKWFANRFITDPNLVTPIIRNIKFTLGRLIFAHFTRAIGGETHKGIVDMSRRIETAQIIQREEGLGQKEPMGNKLRGFLQRRMR